MAYFFTEVDGSIKQKRAPQKDPHMYRTLTYDGAGTKNQSLESWREKRFFTKLYKDNYYVYEKN